MNNYKTKSIAAAFALALGGLSLSAQAEEFGPEADSGPGSLAVQSSSSRCNYEGHVVRVSAYESDNNSFVYWRESALDNDYYYARIEDSHLLNAALHAMNGPVHVGKKGEKGGRS